MVVVSLEYLLIVHSRWGLWTIICIDVWWKCCLWFEGYFIIYILPLWFLLRNQQVVGYSIWIGWLPHWEGWAQFWSTLCSTSQYHCTPAFPFKQLFNRPVQEPIRSQVSSCQVLQWYIRHHKIKIGIQCYNSYCIILRFWMFLVIWRKSDLVQIDM